MRTTLWNVAWMLWAGALSCLVLASPARAQRDPHARHPVAQAPASFPVPLARDDDAPPPADADARAQASAGDTVEAQTPPALAKPAESVTSARRPLELERPPRVAERTDRLWYGWQTLLADGLALSLLLLPPTLDSSGPSGVSAFGLAGLLLASPIVHFAHANIDAALMSLGMRALSAGAVLGGLYVAFSNIHLLSDRPSSNGAVAGGELLMAAGLVGMATAIIIDAGVLAREEPKAVDASALAGFSPWLDPRTRSAGLAFASRL